MYYVSSRSTNRNDVPSLRRKRFANANGAPGNAFIDEEIVPGVEDLQVRLGIDTNGDTNIDQYVNAGAVPANSVVVSATIWLRIRAEEREIGYVNEPASSTPTWRCIDAQRRLPAHPPDQDHPHPEHTRMTTCQRSPHPSGWPARRNGCGSRRRAHPAARPDAVGHLRHDHRLARAADGRERAVPGALIPGRRCRHRAGARCWHLQHQRTVGTYDNVAALRPVPTRGTGQPIANCPEVDDRPTRSSASTSCVRPPVRPDARPDGGYSIGTGFEAYHFIVDGFGASDRGAQSEHRQSFYIVGPGGT